MPLRDKDSGKVIFSSGLTIALLWGFTTCLSHGIGLDWFPNSWQLGFAYKIDNDLMPTGSFLVINMLCWVALLPALNKVRGSRSMSRVSLIIVIGTALLMRLIAIPGEPIHENDFYRYLWDGKVSLSGINPYHYAPEMAGDSQILSGLRESNPIVYDRIGHKAIPTIYPPFAQVVFASSSALFGWSVTGLKGILFCFDMGIVLLLIAILQKLGKNPGWVILYAWNPLVIKEFSNSAHYDAVPVFFCLLALWFTLRNSGTVRKATEVGLALALGTLAKYFAILLLPVLLCSLAREKGRVVSWRSPELWAGVLAFLLLVAAGFLPFFLWDNIGIKGVFAGLQEYNARWQYSPGVFALVERANAYGSVELHFIAAKVIVALVLCAVVVVTALRPTENAQHLAEKCFYVVAALFVLSPTAFPWYFCWVLAFAVLKPRASWLLLGVLLPLNYLDFHSAADIPVAHAQWAGFYLIPSVIWLIFALAWFSERRMLKSG